MINKLLQHFNLRITKIPSIPSDFKAKCDVAFKQLKQLYPDLIIKKDLRYGCTEHPRDRADIQMELVTEMLACLPPDIKILDIGSYRKYILGLLAHYKITTIDIRKRKSKLPNETAITCNAVELSLPDNSFDAVLSLSTIEHIGLGRYGEDRIDLDADRKALKEMKRVLKKDGYLIFSTDVGYKTTINFNSGRVYDYGTIRKMCFDELGLGLVREEIIKEHDLYWGCWKK